MTVILSQKKKKENIFFALFFMACNTADLYIHSDINGNH